MSSLGKRGTKQSTNEATSCSSCLHLRTTKFNGMELNVWRVWNNAVTSNKKGSTVAIERRTILSQVIRCMEAEVRKQCDTHKHNKTIYSDEHTHTYTNYLEKVFVCDKLCSTRRPNDQYSSTHTHASNENGKYGVNAPRVQNKLEFFTIVFTYCLLSVGGTVFHSLLANKYIILSKIQHG